MTGYLSDTCPAFNVDAYHQVQCKVWLLFCSDMGMSDRVIDVAGTFAVEIDDG